MTGDIIKILLALDDREEIGKIEIFLNQEGFEVSRIEDGLEVLNQFEEIKPKIILLGLELPNLGGLEICRIIKKDPKGENIPIFLLAKEEIDMDQKFRAIAELKAEDFISKPYNLPVLIDKIRKSYELLKEEKKEEKLEQVIPPSLPPEKKSVSSEEKKSKKKIDQLDKLRAEVLIETDNTKKTKAKKDLETEIDSLLSGLQVKPTKKIDPKKESENLAREKFEKEEKTGETVEGITTSASQKSPESSELAYEPDSSTDLSSKVEEATLDQETLRAFAEEAVREEETARASYLDPFKTEDIVKEEATEVSKKTTEELISKTKEPAQEAEITEKPTKAEETEFIPITEKEEELEKVFIEPIISRTQIKYTKTKSPASYIIPILIGIIAIAIAIGLFLSLKPAKEPTSVSPPPPLVKPQESILEDSEKGGVPDSTTSTGEPTPAPTNLIPESSASPEDTLKQENLIKPSKESAKETEKAKSKVEIESGPSPPPEIPIELQFSLKDEKITEKESKITQETNQTIQAQLLAGKTPKEIIKEPTPLPILEEVVVPEKEVLTNPTETQEPTVVETLEPTTPLPPRYKVGDLIENPDTSPVVTTQIMPQYPRIALQQKEEKTVFVRILVSENGDVEDTVILNQAQLGRFGFAEATEEAVRKWKFIPATKENVRVKTWITIPVPYKIR